MPGKNTKAEAMTLENVRGDFMSRGLYAVFTDPKDAPGEPVAWAPSDLKAVGFAHPKGPAIPLYTREQIENFGAEEWPLPDSPGGAPQWVLRASVRYGVKNERGVPIVKEVIAGVPSDVLHPGHEYTPLYALRRKTRGSFGERFWEWTWEKRIDVPLSVLLTCGVLDLALATVLLLYQQVSGRRVDWGGAATMMLVVTAVCAAGSCFVYGDFGGVGGAIAARPDAETNVVKVDSPK